MISIQSTIKKGAVFWQAVAKQFFDDGCLMRAGALTFTTLLSLVPLIVVGFSVLRLFPAFQGLGESVQAFVFAHFVAESAQLIAGHLQQFVDQAQNLPMPGLISLVIVVILMVISIEQTFNLIWKTERHRHVLSAFLIYTAVLIVLPILVALGLLLGSYMLHLQWITDEVTEIAIKAPIVAFAPTLLAFAPFTALYVFVPNCKVKWVHGMLGALVAAVLFELAKYAFGLYMHYFPIYRLLYGALAAVPIFLLWIYLSWTIILLGAIVSYRLAKR